MDFVVKVSAGEIFDKYTILQIKQKKISNSIKKKHIEEEIKEIKVLIENYLSNSQLINLVNELMSTNEKLWVIEDDIRFLESSKSFGREFIELARSVYITNDYRFLLKTKINELLNSSIVEVKSYEK